ncbi:hypothetical protein B0H10DRAFT_2044672 [Mycena sp. CBHHK59/15]|nr:hypothetical protein B0H10DRAFT_2044672 [Mycena sp. CBHHK59/15]
MNGTQLPILSCISKGAEWKLKPAVEHAPPVAIAITVGTVKIHLSCRLAVYIHSLVSTSLSPF